MKPIESQMRTIAARRNQTGPNERRRLAPYRSRANPERAVNLLQERRTALISAAVTGKIAVRNAVAEEVA